MYLVHSNQLDAVLEMHYLRAFSSNSDHKGFLILFLFPFISLYKGCLGTQPTQLNCVPSFLMNVMFISIF